MTKEKFYFNGLPRAHFAKLGYDPLQPETISFKRDLVFYRRKLWDAYPIAIACAQRFDPTFEHGENYEQLMDPVYESLSRSLESLLRDFLKEAEVEATFSILVTPLHGVLASVEQLEDRHFRIVINEYLLIVLDSVTRFVVNQYENAYPRPPSPGVEHPDIVSFFGERLVWPFQAKFLDLAGDHLNSDFLVRYILALFEGFAPGVCDEPATFDDMIKTWAPDVDSDHPFGYEERRKNQYIECLTMALGTIIGHEVAHVTSGHFEDRVHEAQDQLLGQKLESPILALSEMEADANAADFTTFLWRHVGFSDIHCTLIGQTLAVAIPCLLEGASHQLQYGVWDESKALFVVNSLNAQSMPRGEQIWNTHPSHVERSMYGYGNAISCLRKNVRYENERFLLSFLANICWVGCLGGHAVEGGVDGMALAPEQHPLLLNTSMKARLDGLEEEERDGLSLASQTSGLADFITGQLAPFEKLIEAQKQPAIDVGTFSNLVSTLQKFAKRIEAESE